MVDDECLTVTVKKNEAYKKMVQQHTRGTQESYRNCRRESIGGKENMEEQNDGRLMVVDIKPNKRFLR